MRGGILANKFYFSLVVLFINSNYSKMQLKTKAQLLSAETNTFKGNDGRDVVYSRARFNVEGEIFPLSCKPEQVDVLKDVRGLYGDLTIDILSRVEKVKLVLNTFIPEK